MHLFSKTIITCFLLIIALSPICIADIIDPAYTVERAVYSIKINDDATSELSEEVTTRINTQKVANESPDDHVTYSADKESAKVLEAYTILPNGQHIAVSKNNIHVKDQATNSSYSGIDDTKVIDIIYPNVIIGSKTYYKAVTKTHKTAFKNQFDLFVPFDPKSDVKYFEYNIQHAKNIKLFVDVHEVAGGRIADGEKGQLRYQYTYSHPFALSSEPNAIDIADFAPYLHFSTYEEPLAFGRLFEKASQSKSLVTAAIQEQADKITEGITDDYQQTKAIYNWVSKEIRYVGDFINGNDFTPHEASYVLHRRFGDCKDHNILLISLLKAKNIQASSALINSSEKYKLTKLGTLSHFDHVISYLPKWALYVDTTIGTAPMGSLSRNEIDKPTLLTALNKVGHTKKFSVADEYIINDVKLNIQTDGSIKGTSETRFGGSKELTARNIYSAYEGENKQAMIKEHFNGSRESGTGSFTPTDVYDLNTPFKVAGDFTLDPVSNMPGNGAITIPVGLSKNAIRNKSDKRPEEKINFPYSCQSFFLEDNTTIKFPANVKITKLPENVFFNEKGYQYLASYQLQDDSVTIKRSLTNDSPLSVCNTTDLENWKVFHRVLQRDLRGQIIYE